MAKATPALEITTTDTPPKRTRGGKPIATEKHTVVTEWEEKKKIVPPTAPAKARKASPVEEIEEDEDAEDVDIELPDDVRSVLSEYDSGAGLVMEINRLPNYHLNGKQDPASMQFCGDRDFDPQEYKNILRLYYAKEGVPNFFVLKLKTSERQWIPGGRIGPINVEAATIEEKARHGIYIPHPEPNVVATINQATPQPPYPYPVPPTTPPVDIEAELDRRLAWVDKITRRYDRAQEVSQHQNPPPPSEEDIIVRAALSSPDAQERVAKGLFSKLVGGASAVDEAPWYADIIKEGLMAIAPGINALLTVGAQKMAIAQAMQQQQPQAPPPSLPEQSHAEMPQQQMQEITPQTVPFGQYEPEPEEEIFGMLLKDCAKRKLVTPAICAQNVLDFVDANTLPNGFNRYAQAVSIFLATDVAVVIEIAATQNPIAAKMATEPDVLPWLKSVQDEIRKEWANDGEDNQDLQSNTRT